MLLSASGVPVPIYAVSTLHFSPIRPTTTLCISRLSTLHSTLAGMRTYSASAIVLKRIDLGEKDRILTLFTREHGKLSAVAKGCRRPGSKLGGASEPFTYAKMFLSTGRDLDVLTQAEIKESFPNVKGAMSSVAHGVYLLELTNSFVDQRQPNPDMFDTLLSAMYVLESGTDPEVTARYFEIQMLSILGYDPHVDVCLRCGREILKQVQNDVGIQNSVNVQGDVKVNREKVSFSPALGGIVCSECGNPPPDAIQASSAVASYVNALRKAEPHRLKEMSIPKGARRDLARMLKWHIRYRLEHDLKSVEFVEAIASFEP